MKDKEVPIQTQLPLNVIESGVRLPANLSGMPDGTEIEKVLSQQRMWVDKPKRKLKSLVIDKRPNPNITSLLDCDNQSFIKNTTSEERLTDKKLSAVVVVTKPIVPGISELEEEFLDSVRKRLTNAGPIFIFEEKLKGTGPDIDLRTKWIKDANFVETKVLVRASDMFLLWRGRLKKKTKRKPVNLLEGNWFKVNDYRKQWASMAKKHREGGYKVIRSDKSELLASLKSTTYAFRTLSSLRLGFGVEVKGVTCGCEWKIEMNGSMLNTKKCAGGICQNEPSPIDWSKD